MNAIPETLTFRLGRGMRSAIFAEAEKQHSDASTVVREAVALYLAEQSKH